MLKHVKLSDKRSIDQSLKLRRAVDVMSVFCVSVILLLNVHGAQANPDQGQSLSLGGDAPPMCAITSPPTSSSASNMTVNEADLGQGRILIGQLIDPGSALLQPASIELSFDVTCNAPHQVEIRSANGALEPETPVTTLAEGFATEVHYSAVLTWNGRGISITADGNAATAQSGTLEDFAITGTAGLQLLIDASLNDMARPLAEGRYIDTLIIQLSPHF